MEHSAAQQTEGRNCATRCLSNRNHALAQLDDGDCDGRVAMMDSVAGKQSLDVTRFLLLSSLKL
jgi:hypothetical protein